MIAQTDGHVNNYFLKIKKIFEDLCRRRLRLVRVIHNIAFRECLVNCFFASFRENFLPLNMWYSGENQTPKSHCLPMVPMKGSGSFLPCSTLLIPLKMQ